MNASTVFFNEDLDVTIEEKDVRTEVSITEAGTIDLDIIESPRYKSSPEHSKNIKSLSGTAADGARVELTNVVVTLGLRSSSEEGSYQFVNSISTPSEMEIDGTGGYVSREGEDISVKFDVFGFQHFIPPSAVDEIELISRQNWRATASPVSNLNDRIEYIKSHKILLRTAEVVISLDEPGGIPHQVDMAQGKLEDILALSGFVQGLGPNFVRAELVGVGDKTTDSIDGGIRYTKLWATQGSIGGAFKAKRLVWGNEFLKYLDEAFDNFDMHIKDEIRLRHVIEYYWDALNSTRPVEGRYLSVCSAIELLAKRYSDCYKQQSRTQDRIEFLVDQLDVETDDLAEFAGTSDRAASSKYFYSYSRQYVVHGDNNPTWDELVDDFEAALTLLQRIIRNQLIGPLGNNSGYDELTEIVPQGVLEFD